MEWSDDDVTIDVTRYIGAPQLSAALSVTVTHRPTGLSVTVEDQPDVHEARAEALRALRTLVETT